MAAKQKRLTARTFKKMLEAHPRFPLIADRWIERRDIFNGAPACGGCAMTLAYYHAHPRVSVANLPGCDVLSDWAQSKYGCDYMNCFLYGFDTGDKSSDHLGGFDGIACRAVAEKMGRIAR